MVVTISDSGFPNPQYRARPLSRRGITLLPYLAYPVRLIAALLGRRELFTGPSQERIVLGIRSQFPESDH